MTSTYHKSNPILDPGNLPKLCVIMPGIVYICWTGVEVAKQFFIK